MAGLIPQSFIDDLLDRVDIVDVVGSRVDLRKSGKNYSACCPFHEEKTPSFTVSPEKQFFYCFGCRASGNAVGFLMDYDRIDFPEAVEQLAQRLGLDVPRETTGENPQHQRRKALLNVLEEASRYFRRQLREHQAAKTAVDYLRQRGLSGEVAREFALGYAPPGWDKLLNSLGSDDERLLLLKESGLLVDRPEDGKLYDRFRQRIMFPIRDSRGRTIGFGGRVLGDDKPKYLNSPESPVFHKGRELYGLFEAHRALPDIPNLLLVEGYMDVIALAQNDIRNVVATLGTAATHEHLEKLFRYTSEVVFCFDGDAAGRKAGRRALETALPLLEDGHSARFLFLPESEDPDSLVRKIGAEKFRGLIDAARPLSEFLFAITEEGLNLTIPEGKAQLRDIAAPLINRIPEGVFHQLMLKELAGRTGMESEVLSKIIAPPPQSLPPHGDIPLPNSYPEMDIPADIRQRYPRKRVERVGNRRSIKLSAEKTLIALLVNQTELIDEVRCLDEIGQLDNPDVHLFVRVVELLRQNPGYTLNHILGHWRGLYGSREGELLAEIAATDLMLTVGDTERNNRQEFVDILNKLQTKALHQLPGRQLLEQLSSRESIDDEDLKILYATWHNLSSEERSEETKVLFNQILSKPRRSRA